jgi:hypothetical protein
MQSIPNEFPAVGSSLIEEIEKDPSLPSIAEQADNLIVWLGDELKGREGAQVPIDYERDFGRVGGSDGQALAFLHRELSKKGLVVDPDPGKFEAQANAWLTFDGWARYEELWRGRAESRRAFMAMRFGNPELDRVVDVCFKPAVEKTGFKLERLNDNPEAGSITNRMRLEILRSRFAVVDLTGNNPGAYWEAGYAEGLGKPVIYTCERLFFDKTKTHFDVAQQQHVLWDANRLDDAAAELKQCIRVTLPDEAKLED